MTAPRVAAAHPHADLPPIRTFKPRRRALTPARSELFADLAPRWCLATSGPPLDAVAVFGRRAPLEIEIGIGTGDTLVAMARADHGVDLIGVDVHTPGIAATLARLATADVDHVRLVHGDVFEFLERVPLGSVDAIRAFFPDPWPKTRHRHRRLIAGGRLATIVDALVPGGSLHLATDIDDYALHARRECDAESRLAGGVIDRPDWRPMTRYERKGLAAGRTITDLVYQRIDEAGHRP